MGAVLRHYPGVDALAQGDHGIAVEREVGAELPLEVAFLDYRTRSRHFHAAVADGAGVYEDVVGAVGIGNRHLGNEVGCDGVVPGGVEGEAVLEHAHLKTHLPGRYQLGTKVGIGLAGGDGYGARETGVLQGFLDTVGSGVVTHLCPGSAQLHEVDETVLAAEVEEVVERHASRNRRIEERTVLGRESAGPVVTAGDIQEHAVFPRQRKHSVEGVRLTLVRVVQSLGLVCRVGQRIDAGNHESRGGLSVPAVFAVNDAATHVAGEIEVAELGVVFEEEVSRVLLGQDVLLAVPAVRLCLRGSGLPLGAEVVGEVQAAAHREVQPLGEVALEGHVAIYTVAELVVDTFVSQEICVVLGSGQRRVLLEVHRIQPVILRPVHVNVGGVAPQGVHDSRGAVARRNRDVVLFGVLVID